MTDLQLILIAGGILLILFIIIYNWKRARRIRREQIESPFTEEQKKDAEKAGGSQSVDTIVARIAEEEAPVLVNPDSPVLNIREMPIDELIECVIPIEPESEVPAEKILPLLYGWNHAGIMPVRFVGLTEDENGQKGWYNIQKGKVYTQFRACVLLANSHAALTEIEFSSLIAQLNHITANIDAEMEVPDMQQVIDHAQQLYGFVTSHDAKVRLSVRSNGEPWPRAQVEEVLAKYQYLARDDGTWVKTDLEEDDNCELFLLGTLGRKDSGTVMSLILFLDLPCIPREKDPFGQMVSCAHHLCETLDGTLVDEKGNVLTDEYAAAIAGQLEQYYQIMQSASLHAGSLRSLRLYR